MKKEIRVRPEKCTGCRICELICSSGKHNEFNPKRSRIRIVKMERFFIDIPTLCQQCDKPLCIKNCESGAISKTITGVVIIDKDKCIGCEECIAACPFNAIFLDPLDQKAIVCDLCEGNPKCVQWCPTEAITWQDIPSKGRKRSSTALKEAKRLVKRWGIPLEEWERYNQKKEI